ncbi:HAD-IA family hydrolase [Acidothermaceae bacterium B102]|nr:HAD-IA family hydrolase [Acidothermaceae bacterium B102]
MRPVSAVLFDFAGTLLVPEPREEWVAAVCPSLSPVEVTDLALRLEQAGRSGGPEPVEIPPWLADDYRQRDLSTARHRELYEGLIEPVVGADLARRLYERGIAPEGWTPYPDAELVLRTLHDQGVPVAVVSNVGFDLPAVFAGHGLSLLIKSFVLSTDVGVMKPAAAMFAAACEALGVEPADALMVGDNFRADGGAVELGMRTLLLPYTGPGVDHGLDAVLRLV